MGKMQPIGPLMIEHRLIERMLVAARRELDRFLREKKADPPFIKAFVDFIRTYADRCHHGKEEDILFRELDRKDISPEHRKVTDELIAEHKWARQQTRELLEATARYEQGDEKALLTITARISALSDFYPRHIEKEDQHFFLPIMRYFSPLEKDAMLQEGYDFDRKLIHERYTQIVEEAEKRE